MHMLTSSVRDKLVDLFGVKVGSPIHAIYTLYGRIIPRPWDPLGDLGLWYGVRRRGQLWRRDPGDQD
jgi:hypothetical protein